MTDPKTCRNCKHWDSISVERLMAPSHQGGFAWGDRNEAARYAESSRANGKHSCECKAILNSLEIELDQCGGWDAGGASVDTVSTPPDFGCNLFKEYVK